MCCAWCGPCFGESKAGKGTEREGGAVEVGGQGDFSVGNASRDPKETRGQVTRIWVQGSVLQADRTARMRRCRRTVRRLPSPCLPTAVGQFAQAKGQSSQPSVEANDGGGGWAAQAGSGPRVTRFGK